MSKNNGKFGNTATAAAPSDTHRDEHPPQSETLFTGDSYNALVGSSEHKGGHFQFQSEKLWTLTPKPIDSRFVLDLKSLAENLSAIPFSERLVRHDDSSRSTPIVANLSKKYSILMEKIKADRLRNDSDDKSHADSLSSPPSSEFSRLEIANSNEDVGRDSEEAENMHASLIDLHVSTASTVSVNSTAQTRETSRIPSTDNQTSSPRIIADKKTKTSDLESWLDSILDE